MPRRTELAIAPQAVAWAVLHAPTCSSRVVTPAATPCRAWNQQGLAALLPCRTLSICEESGERSQVPGGGIVMTSLVISPGCLSTQSWWGCHVQLGALWLGALRLRELVGLPRSAGCLASCARSGVLCLLWGLVPALGSCARSGVLCPLWGLVPALGSCARSGVLCPAWSSFQNQQGN